MAGARGVRSPPQGGLPPAGAVTGAVVEIACDESGFSGSNLLDPATPVITHASVDLTAEEAAALIAALRSRFRLAPYELKSGRFLRLPGAAAARDWLLAALRGRAHVHLLDKEFFLVSRVVDLLLAEPSYAAGTRLAGANRPAAVALYRAGPAAGGDWAAFLAAFADLVRTRRRHPCDRRVQRFVQARDALAGHGLGPAAGAVLAGLRTTRVRALAARLDDADRSVPPPLEPLLPALAETVLSWSRGQRQVLVVHDEQSALTADRLTRLRHALADGAVRPGAAGALPAGVSPLGGLVTVDSRDDARVQVADLLAGVARRSRGTVDGAALQPLLTPTSLPGR